MPRSPSSATSGLVHSLFQHPCQRLCDDLGVRSGLEPEHLSYEVVERLGVLLRCLSPRRPHSRAWRRPWRSLSSSTAACPSPVFSSEGRLPVETISRKSSLAWGRVSLPPSSIPRSSESPAGRDGRRLARQSPTGPAPELPYEPVRDLRRLPELLHGLLEEARERLVPGELSGDLGVQMEVSDVALAPSRSAPLGWPA